MTTVDHQDDGAAEGSSAAHGAGLARTSQLERAKVAASVVFLVNGMTFATWAGRIPSVRDDLGLTPGQLGLLMLIGSAGSLLGLPFAGRLADRYGTARVVLAGAAITHAALSVAGLTVGVLHSVAVSVPFLFAAMFGIGLWDVAMNLEGAAVEQRLGRTIMPLSLIHI